MKSFQDRNLVAGQHVASFMAHMHRFDRGRTLALLHAAKLTTAQLATLETARHGRTVSQLAEDLGLSRPAMSQLVEKLVRAGLLSRVEDTYDRRQRNLALSPRGEQLVSRVAAARAARFEAALAGVPAKLKHELSSVLAKVVAALAAEESKP